MADTQFDLIVIGAGPGGYVAAIRAAQLGLRTACIEKVERLGGTCLRVGCIPSKALLESSEKYHEALHGLGAHGVNVSKVGLDLPVMLKRKDDIVEQLTSGVAFLFKKYGVTHFYGSGRISGPGRVVVEGQGASQELTCTNVLIATGSHPTLLPGIEPDYDIIGTSTEALAFPEVPKTLIVIGGGYIGLEMASVWSRLGSKVTVLEYADRILTGMDDELAVEGLKILKRQGLEFVLGAKVTGAKVKGKKAVVSIEGKDDMTADRVLVAVGRTPHTEGLGLDSVGIVPDKRGRIEVDEHYFTGVEGFYAIGDVIAGPMLAHKAMEEGVAIVENLVTGYGHVNYNAIPGVVYTHPEIASVGRTEAELKEAGIEYKKGSFLFRPNGRAKALGEIDGKVKILADAFTDRVLGVHIIGARAGDLIAECTLAMEFGASSEDIARTCHAHPSLAEIVKEAALAVTGMQVHS